MIILVKRFMKRITITFDDNVSDYLAISAVYAIGKKLNKTTKKINYPEYFATYIDDEFPVTVHMNLDFCFSVVMGILKENLV